MGREEARPSWQCGYWATLTDASVWEQTRGVLKKALIEHLRSRRTIRHSKRTSTEGQPRRQIIDGISIHERPAEVNDRAIPENWGGDLLSGSTNTPIAPWSNVSLGLLYS
ncbi:MAG: hypothetical protein MRJ67_02845 [Nitrospirales bacterium]|nr:hypothetical protein [Nitrospirales bacterium]